MKTTLKLLSIFAVLLLACNETPLKPKIDYQPEVNVFARFILYESQGTLVAQKNVTVERTFAIDESYPTGSGRGIDDARVVVRSDNQEVEFKWLFDGTYVDLDDKLVIKAGFVYQLEVLLKDGRRVTAETTVPTFPEIVAPSREQEVSSFAPLAIEWRPALFAQHYAVTVYSLDNDFEATIFTDETTMTFYPFLLAFPGRYIVKVAALDQNFYDYLRSRRNRDPLLHIEGGIGAFGSMAFRSHLFFAGIQ